MRNGSRSKTVLTLVGPVEIEVPRDREGTFEPQIVKKRKRRLDGIDEIVLSLTARGLTTGEIAAHFEKVCEERAEWANRPLDRQALKPAVVVIAVNSTSGVLLTSRVLWP